MTTTSAPAHRDPAVLDALRAGLRGELALPGEPGYALATPWNVAVAMAPVAVVAAADAHDVALAVRHAGEHGLRVAVQRTGHGAVALDGDDVLLVHTGRLDACQVDPAAGTARVGAGCTWQQVMDAAAPHGLAPLVGSTPAIGVAGFLTGGGIGPLVRTHGLSSDRVRSFDVVTGEGELLHVSADEHPDLHWGLRGGKHTLGVVTGLEVELLPLTELHGGALYFDGDDVPAVLRTWAAWSEDLPEHASTSLAILQLPPLPDVPPPLAGRMTVAVRFASVADDATCEALLAPLRAVAPPLLDAVGPMPHAMLAAIHADPVDPLPAAEASGLLRELPAEAVEALLDLAGPGSGSPQVVVELRRLGGALTRPPATPDAFCHRDAALTLHAVGVLAPEVAAAVGPHGAALLEAMAPWTTGGCLPNFGTGSGPAWAARAYDAPTRARLAELGERLDPRGVLRTGPAVRA